MPDQTPDVAAHEVANEKQSSYLLWMTAAQKSVAVVAVLLGVFGIQVSVNKVTPTPAPDALVEIREILKAQAKPAPAPVVQPPAKLTLEQLQALVNEYKAEAEKAKDGKK